MCDKLVFDLSQEVEGSPNVFVRKDWINILDNQNQNYSNSQSIIDTSQLSNSNKYMSYREAYLAIPLLLSMGLPKTGISITPEAAGESVSVADLSIGKWNAASTSADYSLGLKNWFGTIIHSMTLDYNGTTTCQQTPYINMWNTFKLMTSLSYQDLISQGCQIGFYPDDSTSFQYFPTGTPTVVGGATVGGAVNTAAVVGTDFLLQGTCNNTNLLTSTSVSGRYNAFDSGAGNDGFLKRQQYINFDLEAKLCQSDLTVSNGATSSKYSDLIYSATSAAGLNASVSNMWKSYIFNRVSGSIALAASTGAGVTPVQTHTTSPLFQIAVLGIIKLKHLHSFFNMCPLLKGVFMKLTLNLNNTSSTVLAAYTTAAAAGTPVINNLHVSSVSNAIGGVNPIMIASPAIGIVNSTVTTTSVFTGTSAGPPTGTIANTTTNVPLQNNGGIALTPALNYVTTGGGTTVRVSYTINISVGATCLDQTLANITGIQKGPLAQSVYLYIPAYTFNPPFEQAMLSSPVKQINYTDVYQYQITNIPSGSFINQLITNGIANIKSILILPYYSSSTSGTITCTKSGIVNNANTGFTQGYPVYQSPYDPAGTGCTSPLSHITSFNVQISGQNAIYNLQKYNFEQFNNQLYGQNAVNGGLTDGLTSGLVGRQEFDMSHCYYYVNVERMLPVEMGVPKSVQVTGQNISSKAMDYFVFVEYGVKISIDILTGARV
jgi:hypothetical protein